jgi:S1-C subfamily serine protease
MEARQSAVGIDVLKKDPPAVENLKKEPGPVATPPAAAAINKQNPVVNIVDQKIHPFPFPPGVMITAGSGFIVDSGRKIVTNRHVIEGGKEFAVRTGLGEIIKAKVLFMSASDDLAVLELDKPLASDRSIPSNAYSKPGVGRNVVVMGYPLWSMLGQGAPSLTNGMVSKRTGLQDDKGTFQITAKVNKGNSGGPVFDLSGNVVGITVGKLDTKKIQDEQGFIPEDINFAIHVDRLPPMVNMKLEGKEPVGQELGTEELYQAMLGKVVMVATYK